MRLGYMSMHTFKKLPLEFAGDPEHPSACEAVNDSVVHASCQPGADGSTSEVP
jgi:hypothetical protein